MSAAPPYSIGSRTLPGLSRLLEEAGEAVQVIGKIIGAGHAGEHFDGSHLGERLAEEIADLSAAIRFVVEANDLDVVAIEAREARKLSSYWEWHRNWLQGHLEHPELPELLVNSYCDQRWGDADEPCPDSRLRGGGHLCSLLKHPDNGHVCGCGSKW